MIRNLTRGPIAVMLLAACTTAWAAETAERPNIIFIMTDDCSRDWLGCYGSQEQATPQLDKLAAGGMRFETFYVTAICTPTRNMLLTGRYPCRTGWISHWDAPRWGGQYFDWNREITFARVLNAAGYATAIGGKWQINDLRTHGDALASHGFDEHCLWTGFESGNPPSGKRYWDAYLVTNGKRRVCTGEFGPDVVNRFLLDFITRHKAGPFLAYYPMILTHGPQTTTPLNRDKLAGSTEKKALYGGMVQYADHLIGKLVSHLDELGIRENTIIFYTGDNGSSCGGRAWGQDAANRAKGNAGDLGCHTPLIANWPGVIEPGQVTGELSDATDMLPTFAELAGAPLPQNVKLDGISIVSILKGLDGPRRQWIYSQVGSRRKARDQRYFLNVQGGLFDLKQDPYQQNDLAQSTDRTVVAAREKLQAVLDSMPQDKQLEGFPENYSKLGKVPALPAGSGKWIEFKTAGKEGKKDKKDQAQSEKRSRRRKNKTNPDST